MQIGRYLQHGIIWDCFGTDEKATGRNSTGEKDSSRANTGYYLGVSTVLARMVDFATICVYNHGSGSRGQD